MYLGVDKYDTFLKNSHFGTELGALGGQLGLSGLVSMWPYSSLAFTSLERATNGAGWCDELTHGTQRELSSLFCVIAVPLCHQPVGRKVCVAFVDVFSLVALSPWT